MARIPATRRTPWLPRIGVWLLVLAALAAAVVGGYLVSIDGEGTCHVEHASCPRVHNTMVGGIALIAGAVAALGLVAFLLTRRRPS